uniref:Putative secreted glycine-rich protein 1 n=1 Tax=Rhodnius prolixus TaxID=13249 RepID=G1K0C8_RHOPR
MYCKGLLVVAVVAVALLQIISAEPCYGKTTCCTTVPAAATTCCTTHPGFGYGWGAGAWGNGYGYGAGYPGYGGLWGYGAGYPGFYGHGCGYGAGFGGYGGCGNWW